MSEETATEEDGQDPSMEDILTNIRDILTDEEEAELAEAKTDPGSESDPEPETDEPETDEPETDEPEAEPETLSNAEPETLLNAEPEPILEPDPIPEPAPMPPALEAMLELTPDMVATEILSEPTSRASTDVLSELAAAILDRRDMAVDTSSRDMTLEGIVREMLKPILREWLDRNLPYLIERLVKREIDLMVNRAERLED